MRWFEAFAPPGDQADAALELATRDQDATITSCAAQPDIRTETVDLPGVGATGVRLLQSEDVAEVQINRHLIIPLLYWVIRSGL